MKRRMVRLVIVSLVALGMGGCATISKETAFDGAQGGAFVMLAGDGMRINGSESFSFSFRKVDLQAGKFLDDSFNVFFSEMPALKGDEFTKPETVQTTLRFAGKQVRHGDYALVSRTDTTAYGYVSNTNVSCFSLGSYVFRIPERSIVLIPVGHVKDAATADPDTIVKLGASVLTSYPKMTAPQTMAEPVGKVTFTTTKGMLGGETCIPEGAISIAAPAAVSSAAGTKTQGM